MTEVDEIIDYIKSLKKGFDKQLFESKIEELAYVAQDSGLEDDDFHTLFKVWLNLSIPITKWISLGCCIMPQDKVRQNTVEYSLRWLLANHTDQNFYPRICFLLDWLTAAMDSDSIDMTALDMGYEVFYTFLTSEVLTPHAIKLIYVLTKPFDVTRKRVLELLEQAKKREVKKNLVRQLHVLIGLFKTYKPECVPEDIPSISVHSTFRKLNVHLLLRFHNCQTRRNSKSEEKQRLTWVNPLNMRNNNKKANPLVPNMEFLHIGSTQYNKKVPQKTYLDFSEPASLLQYSLNHKMSRPARLRALLCNATGHTLLSLSNQQEYTFLIYDLQHVLSNCILGTTAHSYAEKADFLHQLAIFQSTLMQGLPVVTRFLAQFLPFWNERDYFPEILSLLEWVNVESPDFVSDILGLVTKLYCRAHPMQQCCIARSLTNLYANLVYTSTRSPQHFLIKKPSEENFKEVIRMLAVCINNMCSKGLQINPGDIRIVYSSVHALVSCAQSVSRCARGAGGRPVPGAGAGPVPGAGAGPVPGALVLALPLLSNCAALLDMVAELMMIYKQLLSSYKAKHGKDQVYTEQIQVLKPYTSDFVSCFSEQFLRTRAKGVVFRNLPPLLVSKLTNLIPAIDKRLSIRNHLAFAPYTHLRVRSAGRLDDEQLLCETVYREFVHLNEFVTMAMAK